jgi:putative transposase
VQRCTVHKHRNLLANAPERLHEEIAADYNDMIYAATPAEPSCANGGSSIAPSLTASRKPVTACLHSHACRRSSGKSARTTNAVEQLHEEFKRRIKTQTVMPSADTAAMLFWALLASGQISMRKVDGRQTLASKPIDQPIDLASENQARKVNAFFVCP